MALKYVVKKTTFGFDETKTEKYVARPLLAGTVTFVSLCDQVTKVSMVPRGVVKMVLDGLIDVLEMNLVNGLSVRLGDFGSFRTSFGCKSGYTEKKKDYFCSGKQLKTMVKNVSLQLFEVKGTTSNANPNNGRNAPDTPE